jgi:ubiquinone/menaquinone biosynthesis C-methylase UbiE
MDIKTIETYNKLAKEYDDETVHFWNTFPKSFFDYFITHTKGKVLDIGSGPGRDGMILKNAGLDVMCLDASQSMIDLSTKRGLTSVLGDFLHLPFQEKSFDGVWAYTSLLHCPKKDFKNAILEVRKVLKEGGYFGLGLIEGDEELYKENMGKGNLRLFSYFKKEEVEDILREEGFELVYFEIFKPGSRNYLNFIFRK